MGSWLEAVIIGFILIGIAVAIFKGGAANPVSTGGLGKRLSDVDGDLRALTTKVDTVETKVGAVETRVSELNQLSATKGDIERLEKQFQEWKRQIDRLDERFDGFDRDLTRIQGAASNNQTVIEAMSSSLRMTNTTMNKIETRMETNATITAQVPAFMEKVLTGLATNTARTDAVCKQVDVLYHFITERGITK